MIARRKKRMTKSRLLVKAAFHETKHVEPKIVAETRREHGAARARKQLIAISLSKARRAGARLPKYKRKAA